MTYITDMQRIELYHIKKCVEYYRQGEMKPKVIDKFIDGYNTKYKLKEGEFFNHFKHFNRTGGLEGMICKIDQKERSKIIDKKLKEKNGK